MVSSRRKLIGATALVALLTIVARAVGMAREMAMADYFGTGDQVDAYIIAFLVPNFVVSILVSSLCFAFIPAYIDCDTHEGSRPAESMLASVTLAVFGVLLLATIALCASCRIFIPLLAPAFSPAKSRLTEHLFIVLSPSIILSGMTTLWTGVLNARHRFALGALLPSVATATALLFLVALRRRMGIYSLALGYSLGFFLQAIALYFALRRSGICLRARWGGLTPRLESMWREYLPAVAGGSLMTGINLVEQFMAASLPPGNVASLGYAMKLTSFVSAILGTALGTTILPHFSAITAKGDRAELLLTLRSSTRWVLALGAFCSAFVILASREIVTLLYAHGHFGADAIETVSNLQKLYALQLPFFAGGVLLVRLISALRANRILLWSSGISLALNVSLNLLFIKHLGVFGVALTNTIMYVVSYSFLFLAARVLVKQWPERGVLAQ